MRNKKRFLNNALILVVSKLPLGFTCDYIEEFAKSLSKTNKVLFIYPPFLYNTYPLKRVVTDHKIRKLFFDNFKAAFSSFAPIRFWGITPFQRFSIIRALNHKLNTRILKVFIFLKSGFKKMRIIVWNFDTGSDTTINRIPRDLTISDCTDSPNFCIKNSNKDRIQREEERLLLLRSDFVFVNSQALLEQKKKFNFNTFVVPAGFPLKSFLEQKSFNEPEELKRIPAPRILFEGVINIRLDFKLLKKVIREKKTWNFLFLGPIDGKEEELKKALGELRKLPNCHFFGYRTKREVANFIYHSDVGIVPYDTSIEFNLYSNPIKAYEYLALGKWVVSTPVLSLKELSPLVKIDHTPKKFVDNISYALKKKVDKNIRREMRDIARANTIERKLEAVDSIIGNEV